MSKKPIIFRNYGNETPIIDGTNISPNYGALVLISGKSYIKVIGFEIRNYKSTDSKVVQGIRVDGGSSAAIIDEFIEIVYNGLENIMLCA